MKQKVIKKIFLLVLLMCWSTNLHAQQTTSSFTPPGTPAEREAYQALRESRFIKARELSEAILKQNPDSMLALFTMAKVMHYGETNLPKALFNIHKLRTLFEKLYGTNPVSDNEWKWYWEILAEHADIAQEMNLSEEELTVLMLMDKIYGSRPEERVFPLVKLGRFDEARTYVNMALLTDDPNRKQRAMNGLCWLEYELETREAAYIACKNACDTFPYSATLCNNAAEGAVANFKMDEAERYYLKAGNMVNDGFSSPWVELVTIYTGQGRLPEALSAVKRSNLHRMAQPAYMDQQVRAGQQGAVAYFLMALGYTSDAYRIATNMVESPDRTGGTSGSDDDINFSYSTIYLSIIKAQIEFLREEMALTSWLYKVKYYQQIKALELTTWNLQNQILTLLSKKKVRLNVFRPYLNGLDGLQTWLVGDLIPVMGTALFDQTLKDAAKVEEKPDNTEAYFLAWNLESLYLQGKYKKVVELAQGVMDKLPRSEIMLKARIGAIAGECANRIGDASSREVFWNAALENFPAIFRSLSITLPIQVSSDKSAMSDRIKSYLFASPRLSQKSTGYMIELTTSNTSARLCLYRQNQNLHGCSTTKFDEKKSKDENAKSTVRDFIQMMMSPKLNLSQSDINSLEGSPASDRVKKKTESILQQIGQ